MRPFLAGLVAACAMTAAGMVLAQPAPDSGGADPAPAHEGAYTGAGSPQRFYDVGQRIDQMQAAINAGALPKAQARQATKQLNAIRGELKFRMARKNGQLLDWDRELITQKLDALKIHYPALGGAQG